MACKFEVANEDEVCEIFGVFADRKMSGLKLLIKFFLIEIHVDKK